MEDGGGYGLVQWTPASKLEVSCNTLGISPYTDGNIQLEVIIAEILGTPNSINEWYSSSAFISPYYESGATSDMIGITGQDFLNNSMKWNVEKLAILFMVAYERPSYSLSENRADLREEYAKYWYNYLQGIEPTPPPQPPTPHKKVKNKWIKSSIRKILIKY